MKLPPTTHTVVRYALRGLPYVRKPGVPSLVRHGALIERIGEKAGFVAVFRHKSQAITARKLGLRRIYRKVTIVKVRINVTEIS